jgi:hypothetical protein
MIIIFGNIRFILISSKQYWALGKGNGPKHRAINCQVKYNLFKKKPIHKNSSNRKKKNERNEKKINKPKNDDFVIIDILNMENLANFYRKLNSKF